MHSRRRCVVLWLGKYWISRGRNVLLQGNSWRLRFDGLSLRFWQKTNSFATLTRVFFSQTSTRVHQILIPTHNHEVTPYPFIFNITQNNVPRNNSGSKSWARCRQWSRTFGGSLSPRPFIYINDFIDMSQGITVAANPERGIGNDPEPLGVAGLHLDPVVPRFTEFWQALVEILTNRLREKIVCGGFLWISSANNLDIDIRWRSSVRPSTYVFRMAAFIKWPSHTKHVSTCRVLVMAPKSFKLDCYSCKQLLKDSSLTLIWFCFVLFLIVFMKVPSEHSNNVIYCIRWLSNAFLVQCFQNFPWTPLA